MRFSQLFISTLREAPAEAEAISHQLMLRAGMIRKLAPGIYSFLPLGYRVLRKIEQIIREEMDSAGAQELMMPSLLPTELYKRTGRGETSGTEMFRLKDRNERELCLASTYEEVFTETVKNEVSSYKSLPINLYQIQSKYQDEIKPRFGVVRARESIMKDAYSFDRDEAGLEASFEKMLEAYHRIFGRCGLNHMMVEAGTDAREFMVRSDIGDAAIAYCERCGYAADRKKARCIPDTCCDDPQHLNGSELPMEKVATPDARTIEDLVKFFNASSKRFAKTLIYKADGKVIGVMVRGDREVNEIKLRTYLGCDELIMADPETVKRVTGADVGFAGPVGLKADLIADLEVAAAKNLIVGANDTGYHFKNVNIPRDCGEVVIADVRNTIAGDPCPECGSPLKVAGGIKIGHTLKLGTKYSKALNCIYLDEAAKEHPMVMGCYGIGVDRTMAAIIEQNHDENGIIWPTAVAPYQVTVIVVNPVEPVKMEIGRKIYSELEALGMDVILDDRNERAGVKFMDTDLIGIPVRITVGKKAAEGIVEYKLRWSREIRELRIDQAVDETKKEISRSLNSINGRIKQVQ